MKNDYGEKFCNKRHNNGNKFFALYNNKKGEEKKAGSRCVSNTGIVKFLLRAEGKWFVQLEEKKQTLLHTKGQLISKCPFGVFFRPKNQQKNFCPSL